MPVSWLPMQPAHQGPVLAMLDLRSLPGSRVRLRARKVAAMVVATPLRAVPWERPVRATALERFEARIEPEPEPNTGCSLWSGSGTPKGYGQFRHLRNSRAHRVAWELFVGPIPPGLHVLHSCDVPACVRADKDPARSHLFLGTNSDNMANRDAKGRQSRGDSHYSRRMPGRLARGDRSGSRLHPEKVARGDLHGFRLHPECVPRGTGHGMAKLNEDSVREIRRRAAAGEVRHEIALDFRVCDSTVSLIVLRKHWRHVK